jgi:hypothetical protein
MRLRTSRRGRSRPRNKFARLGWSIHRLVLVTTSVVAACARHRERPVFKLLESSRTGVTFANTITTNDSLNFLTDAYVYNGAGVAVGDIDNDGFPDIFFAGNQVSSRLYLNKQHMRFQDITDRAGVRTNRWATGVAMVDINADGFLDIYVSVSGPPWSAARDRANLLFVNNGDRTFTESAARYGIADTGFTTHAAFLDYDGDGCLDLFLLENSPKDFARGGLTTQPSGMRGRTPDSYNQLYRNNCDGTFTNVSDSAGILKVPGYGLGVVVADLNRDGWPDIYVSNDITPNDVLYINNRDGTFSNTAARSLKHTSYSGMGLDIADFNNDGWPDIAQVDMMPHDPSRRKQMSGLMSYESLLEARRAGFRDDYSENVLQLSNGVTPAGDVVFSDIARLAGVATTDWSWSALFADLDNDGYKDLFITNGYPKAVNDLDYQTVMFAVGRRRAGGDASSRAGFDILKRLYAYEASNYLFRNAGNLTFTDVTGEWGFSQRGFSYGAAYSDLDNDGTLDLIVSNLDAPAFIYQNTRAHDPDHHELTVELRGEGRNRQGIGATLILTSRGRRQYLYHSPYRGFMSSMDDREHFGLGAATRVDSLQVFWPDGRYQSLIGLEADRVVVVRQATASEKGPVSPPLEHRTFEEATGSAKPMYKRESALIADYTVQPLLPYEPSSQGPPLAVADVNGDGLDDVFVGGGGGVPGKLFVQRKDGRFTESSQGQPWAAETAYEDWGALFFDANGDGKPDLYVASCGYRLAPESPLLQDRLYINVGAGRFARDSLALPSMRTCTAAVRAADFNGDGRLDLFVGGRLAVRDYPLPTRSYLLRNDGGRFTDVTSEIAPELLHPGGMITDAVWVDVDGDGRVDLVTAGEWMPLQFFHNDGARFHDATRATKLPSTRGWWYSLAVGDFDGDGRPDVVAGNLGLNYTYTTSPRNRFGVYAGDFTGRRSADVVLTKEIDGTEYPFYGLVPLGREIDALAMRFPTYGSFAHATIRQAFSPAQLAQAVHYQADTFASVLLHNNGDGSFTSSPLPNLAQIAPVRGMVTYDVDGDGHLDLIIAGNLYDTEPNTARADAGNGLWLRGDGRGHFTPVPPTESGFLAPLDVSGLGLINTPTGKAVLVANAGDSLQVFRIKK